MLAKTTRTSSIVVPVLAAIALVAVIGYALASTFLFDNDGTITAVAVTAYTDAGQSTPVTLIAWGDLEPGAEVTALIYVNSTSTIPVSLNLTTADWTPLVAADYLNLTWNLEDTVIQPLALLEATLTLTVSSDIVGVTDFSFTAIITGADT